MSKNALIFDLGGVDAILISQLDLNLKELVDISVQLVEVDIDVLISFPVLYHIDELVCIGCHVQNIFTFKVLVSRFAVWRCR